MINVWFIGVSTWLPHTNYLIYRYQTLGKYLDDDLAVKLYASHLGNYSRQALRLMGLEQTVSEENLRTMLKAADNEGGGTATTNAAAIFRYLAWDAIAACIQDTDPSLLKEIQGIPDPEVDAWKVRCLYQRKHWVLT